MRHAMLGCLLAVGCAAAARAAEFHVTTAQELQNALTAAAANGEGDTVYVAAGYYTGNFNFNSAEAYDLTVQAESGVANHEITVDGAGTGRSMNLTATAAANLTVRGLTFTRNCNATANAGLRLSTVGDVTVENCRAIGATSDLGMGIEIAAAKIAAVRGCAVTRDATSRGDGIKVAGVTGSVTVEQNQVSGNNTLDGYGVYVNQQNCTVPLLVADNNVCSNYSGGILVYASRNQGSLKVSRNTASFNAGRGIYMDASWGSTSGGEAELTENVVCGNNDVGIHLYCYRRQLATTLSRNTVSGNRIDRNSIYGGGVYIECEDTEGMITLTGNTVTGNSIFAYYGVNGGGLYIKCRRVTLTGNTVSGNTASSTNPSSSCYGGGICLNCSGGTITLEKNTVYGNSHNSSNAKGGGVYALGATVKLLGNMIYGNRQTSGSGGAGGGVWVNATTLLDMVNNTVTANAAAGIGGGAAFQVDGVAETLHVYNNIFFGNAADGNGDDVHVAGSGSRKEFMYNDAHDLYGVWDLSEHNLDAAPLFYDAANQNYHLRNGSPCLNAGYNSAPSILATDIDGEARVTDTTVDMGADEMSNTDPHPADLNDDWVISEAEYTAYAAAWKSDQAWSRQPSPVPADYVTRAGYLMQQSGGAYRNDGGPKPTCWVPQ